jgi:hypothetical protein
MRNSLLSWGALAVGVLTYAQTVPAGENISLDTQLSNVPQNTVTSGIIYERVITAANLYNFNKVSTFNQANFGYFKQALSEMRNASNNTRFVSLDQFKTTVAATTGNVVDVAILNTQFQVLNYNEENPSAGGLTFNTTTNKYATIAGKVPFYTLHNTVIAPTKDYVTGASIVYKLRNDLYFRNGARTIKKLVANFGDGINRTLINNGVLTNNQYTINYTSSGEKVSTYVITYNDNSVMTTYGMLYLHYDNGQPILNSVNDPPTACTINDPLKQDFSLRADIAFQGYRVGDPTIKAKIDYRVFYANGNNAKKILKPIIIIDGFDPGDKRQIEDCDCANIPDCEARNTSNGAFDPQLHRSMTDLMLYFEGNQERQLLDKLRADGYDVIMVNHPTYKTDDLNTPSVNNEEVTIDGGAYYIESNAYALVKLITRVNEHLTTNASTAKIAMVGPSMGGQISRYALAYMEKNNLPHNTYLWISVDSPHLGANIPMGDQALLYLLKDGGIDAAGDFYDKELSSPASQQQLIEFHRPEVVNGTFFGLPITSTNYHKVNQDMLNGRTASQNFTNDRGNTMFQDHYNAQNANGLPGSDGWPQNLRRISLVNGSLTGSKETQTPNGQNFIPFSGDNEKMLNLRAFQSVGFGILRWKVHVGSLEAFSMPAFGADQRIARFKKRFKDKTTRSPNINSRGNMDNVPGGFYNAQEAIFDSSTAQNPASGASFTELRNWRFDRISFENFFKTITQILGGTEWNLHQYNPIHSFIPSFSSLAHLQPDQSWANPLDVNLLCSSNTLTPFDSYFGLAKNTQHTSFTKESVDWLIEELNGNPQQPVYPISAASFSVPEIICVGETVTVGFEDECKLMDNATFTATSNLWLTQLNGYQATITGQSNGSSTVRVNLPNGQSITKQVIVGTPQIELAVLNQVSASQMLTTLMPEMNDCNRVGISIDNIPNFNLVQNIEMRKLPGSQARWDGDNRTTSYNGAVIAAGCNELFAFEVRAKNACGWSEWRSFEITLNECTSNCRPAVGNTVTANFVISPVPANTFIMLSLVQNPQWTFSGLQPIDGGLFDLGGLNPVEYYVKVELFDFTSNPVLTINNHLLGTSFSVAHLPAGNYFLRISHNGQVETCQIIII